MLCGSIFPIAQLPPGFAALGGMLPVTYWLEAARRGLLGATIGSFPGLSNEEVMARLVVTTVASRIVGGPVFALGERHAKTTGNLDRTSNY